MTPQTFLSKYPRARDTYKDILDLEAEFSSLYENNITLWFLKYDGIWGQLEINTTPGELRIYSRTGTLKFKRKLTSEEKAVFGDNIWAARGEFMFGQQWANHPSRRGKIFLWETLVHNGLDLEHHAFVERLGLRSDFLVINFAAIAETVSSPSSPPDTQVLEKAYKEAGFEGVVGVHPMKKHRPVFYRYKPDLEDDVIITGFLPGKGKHTGSLGAVRYGMFKNGDLITLGDCGGGFSDELRKEIWNNKEKYLGRVFTATSKLRFDSGALRSANFKCFRPDKPAYECKVKPCQDKTES